MEEHDKKFYNIFMNDHSPPQDFLKLLTNTNSNNSPPRKHKETDDGINIGSHLKFLEEVPTETLPQQNYSGTKQYSNTDTIIHSMSQSMGKMNSNVDMSFLNAARVQPVITKGKRMQIFFNDMNDIERLNKTPEMKLSNDENEIITDDNQLSPVYYANSPPPGLLTPTKFAQYIKDVQVNIENFIISY